MFKFFFLMFLQKKRVTGKKPFAGGDYKQILRANKACQIDFQDPLLKHASSTSNKAGGYLNIKGLY